MIYTEKEQRDWWAGLSHGAQMELLDFIDERMSTPYSRTLIKKYMDNVEFTKPDLNYMRKWYQ